MHQPLDPSPDDRSGRIGKGLHVLLDRLQGVLARTDGADRQLGPFELLPFGFGFWV